MFKDQDEIEIDPIQHREITLADGRYMIFYTFGGAVPNDLERKAESGEPASAGGDTDNRSYHSLPDEKP